MRWSSSIPIYAAVASGLGSDGGESEGNEVDLKWYPPANTSVNDLGTALNGTGVYGFIFNSSYTPDEAYGTYNWCNMPHVRRQEYPMPPPEYELKYVEVIQRHHKRTPYASNAFPVEPYHWDCDDEGLFYYGSPFEGDKRPAKGYWAGFTSTVNPFAPSGWVGTCSFPQLTSAGLDDAYVHGQDIYGVYHDLLGFLPSRDQEGEDWREGGKVMYRVTQNVITSQVAGMLISGTWAAPDDDANVPLLVEAAGVDSLEPQYPCAAGNELSNRIKSDADAAWRAHLEGAKELYASLDDVSGVPPDDAGFHASFDHYFDNLSARQCHDKPLPCKLNSDSEQSRAPCIDQALADAVYRLGEWEYAHMYRASPLSLAASVSTYGVWIAELAAHLRDAMTTTTTSDNDSESNYVTSDNRPRKGSNRNEKKTPPLYFHNVAHDGSVSRLLSILQIDDMVWPGMGSEVVFELYVEKKMKKRKSKKDPGTGAGTGTGTGKKKTERKETGTGAANPGASTRTRTHARIRSTRSESGYYLRVLFSGQVLRSSNPSLGVMDMVPLETVLAYFDGLVGKDASLVLGKCNGTITS
ncbi:histidine acid phosphatase [Xylariaceae sp. FL0594]|nr:histidine acid phosphatase [Xylariaceae sp. FL0594]